ncbi:AraC family transcriptional regulator [Arachidicoccus ginsenosidimutans]
MTGFSDPKYFSKQFKKQFGKTPYEFIQSRDI